MSGLLARCTLLACLLACLPAAAAPRVLEGRAGRISDGDTLWLQPFGQRAPVKLRLRDIDAPEICQRWGAQSRRALADLVAGAVLRAELTAHDDYGRGLARLSRGELDVGAQLVRQGHAWAHRYRGRPGPYAQAEEQARRERRGLFADPQAIAPRDFRRRFGPCRDEAPRVRD